MRKFEIEVEYMNPNDGTLTLRVMQVEAVDDDESLTDVIADVTAMPWHGLIFNDLMRVKELNV